MNILELYNIIGIVLYFLLSGSPTTELIGNSVVPITEDSNFLYILVVSTLFFVLSAIYYSVAWPYYFYRSVVNAKYRFYWPSIATFFKG